MKMIARFITELEVFNKMVETNSDSVLIKSQYNYIKGMQALLEEISVEVELYFHDEVHVVSDVLINDVKYMYISNDVFCKVEK